MRAAHLFAQRSTCPRGRVGAVLVVNKRIIAHGYNGAPPDMPHCDEVGCEELTLHKYTKVDETTMTFDPVELGCQRTVHAEANVIAYAARVGVPVEGSFMFSTHSPCRKCMELAASAGVIKIIYDKTYRATPFELAPAMGIIVVGKEGIDNVL
jgi:dCMP deaminase